MPECIAWKSSVKKCKCLKRNCKKNQLKLIISPNISVLCISMLIRVLFRWLNNIFFEFWPMKKSKSVTFEGLSGSACYVGSRKFCNRGYYEPLFRDTAIYSQPDKDLQMWNELCNSKKKKFRQEGKNIIQNIGLFLFERGLTVLPVPS